MGCQLVTSRVKFLSFPGLSKWYSLVTPFPPILRPFGRGAASMYLYPSH